MSTLNGKTIVIDGVEYRLVAVENEDNRTKVILSLKTPFGYIQKVIDREDLRDDIEEGDIEIDGKHFIVEFCKEDEVRSKVGKPVGELNPVEALLMRFAEATIEDEDEEDD